jgi:hypothetical protein
LSLGFNVLSKTTKMPGPSFSLSAGLTCPGKCELNCYAKRGKYLLPNYASRAMARYQWTVNSSQGEFVKVLVQEIEKSGCQYFRIHDSGDFFSQAYIYRWELVCGRLPDVRFFASTKSWQLPGLLERLRRLAALPNVTIRPSAPRFEDDPPVVEGLHAGASASAKNWTCPAHLQGNRCQECRVCWNDKETPIIYRRH